MCVSAVGTSKCVRGSVLSAVSRSVVERGDVTRDEMGTSCLRLTVASVLGLKTEVWIVEIGGWGASGGIVRHGAAAGEARQRKGRGRELGNSVLAKGKYRGEAATRGASAKVFDVRESIL